MTCRDVEYRHLSRVQFTSRTERNSFPNNGYKRMKKRYIAPMLEFNEIVTTSLLSGSNTNVNQQDPASQPSRAKGGEWYDYNDDMY
jgi:hypothetical protein